MKQPFVTVHVWRSHQEWQFFFFSLDMLETDEIFPWLLHADPIENGLHVAIFSIETRLSPLEIGKLPDWHQSTFLGLCAVQPWKKYRQRSIQLLLFLQQKKTLGRSQQRWTGRKLSGAVGAKGQSHSMKREGLRLYRMEFCGTSMDVNAALFIINKNLNKIFLPNVDVSFD